MSNNNPEKGGFRNGIKERAVGIKNGIQDGIKGKAVGIKNQAKDASLKYWRENREFLIVRGIFFVFGGLAAILGAISITLSLVAYPLYPQLSALTTRILTSGGSLVAEALVAMFCSSICFCNCLKSCNGDFLLRTFLSAFSVGFELILFPTLFLFFESTWIDYFLVNGSKVYIFKIKYAEGASIDDLISKHFVLLRVDAILCVVGFVILIGMAICSAYLISPTFFLSSVPEMLITLVGVMSTEYIFMGSWFAAIETFSNKFVGLMVLYITVGSIIDTALTVLGIVSCCQCGVWRWVWIIARICILGAMTLTCFITFVAIYSTSERINGKVTAFLYEDCEINPSNITSSLSHTLSFPFFPSSSSLSLSSSSSSSSSLTLLYGGESPPPPDPHILDDFNLLLISDSHLSSSSSSSSSFSSFSSSSPTLSSFLALSGAHLHDDAVDGDDPFSFISRHPPFRHHLLSDGEEGPPPYCGRVLQYMHKSYACDMELEDNAKYCDSLPQTAVKVMAKVANGFTLMFAYSSVIVFVFLFVVLVFVIIGVLIWTKKFQEEAEREAAEKAEEEERKKAAKEERKAKWDASNNKVCDFLCCRICCCDCPCSRRDGNRISDVNNEGREGEGGEEGDGGGSSSMHGFRDSMQARGSAAYKSANTKVNEGLDKIKNKMSRGGGKRKGHHQQLEIEVEEE